MKRKKIIYIVAVCCLLISYSFSLVGCFAPGNDVGDSDVNTGVNNETVLAGGMQVGEIQASGIQLLSETVTETSATAEKTVTITASIQPEGVTNQGLLWDVVWTNASSTWANGKNVSDYVTLSVGEDSKVVTISCLQAFGEQITVTALSADNPNVSANCVLEYAQKIISASLNIGDIAVNLGGTTEINVELCPGITGPGGVISAVPVTSEAYTIAEEYNISVTLEPNVSYFGLLNENISLGASNVFVLSGTNEGKCLGSELYFDYDHELKYWTLGMFDDFEDFTTTEIIEIIEELATRNDKGDLVNNNKIASISLTLTSENYEYSYSSQLRIVGYTNSTSVSRVNLDKNSFIF